MYESKNRGKDNAAEKMRKENLREDLRLPVTYNNAG